MKVWTLTVDDTDAIYTSVHHSEADAVQTLLDNYDDRGEFSDAGDLAEQLQAVMDANGLIVHIDEHEL